MIYPDPSKSSHSTCFEGSYFTGYKNYYQGAYAYYKTKSVKFSFMTMIDNKDGFGAAIANSANEFQELLIELSDNKIYGDSEISDCPADGSFCKSYNKFGIILSGATYAGKALMLDSESALPMTKIKSIASWGGV